MILLQQISYYMYQQPANQVSCTNSQSGILYQQPIKYPVPTAKQLPFILLLLLLLLLIIIIIVEFTDKPTDMSKITGHLRKVT